MLTRRTFATLPAAAASAASRPPIRIGFLGAIHSHGQAKIKTVLENSDYALAGVWEPNAVLRDKLAGQGVKIASREEILNDRSVRAVAVESAVRDHFALAKLALEAGKHVHVEKPPAATMREMRQLVELARRNNLLLQSGYMWRYHPAINTALEAARNGWLGDVFQIRGQINTFIEGQGRLDLAEFRGGQMFELGPHLIDVVVRLLGKPTRVTHTLRHDRAGVNDSLADNTVAILEYPKAMAIINTATMQPGAGAHRALEIVGTNGTAVIRPIEPATLRMDFAKPAGPYKEKVFTATPEYRRYVADFIEFAAAIRGEKKLTASLDDELAVQETLLRASGMEG